MPVASDQNGDFFGADHSKPREFYSTAQQSYRMNAKENGTQDTAEVHDRYVEYKQRSLRTGDWTKMEQEMHPGATRKSIGHEYLDPSHVDAEQQQMMHDQYTQLKQRAQKTSDWIPRSEDKLNDHDAAFAYKSAEERRQSLLMTQMDKEQLQEQYKAFKSRGQKTSGWVPQDKVFIESESAAMQHSWNPDAEQSHQNTDQYHMYKERGTRTGDWIPTAAKNAIDLDAGFRRPKVMADVMMDPAQQQIMHDQYMQFKQRGYRTSDWLPQNNPYEGDAGVKKASPRASFDEPTEPLDAFSYKAYKERGQRTGDWIPQKNPEMLQIKVPRIPTPPQQGHNLDDHETQIENLAYYRSNKERGTRTGDWVPENDAARDFIPESYYNYKAATVDVHEKEAHKAQYKSYKERGQRTSDWIPTKASDDASAENEYTAKVFLQRPVNEDMEENQARYKSYKERGQRTSDWTQVPEGGTNMFPEIPQVQFHADQRTQDEIRANYRMYKERGHQTGDWIPQDTAQSRHVLLPELPSPVSQKEARTVYQFNKLRGQKTGDWVPSERNPIKPLPVSERKEPVRVKEQPKPAKSRKRVSGPRLGRFNILTGEFK